MSEIKVTINGVSVTGKSGSTILEIATENGIHIPTLFRILVSHIFLLFFIYDQISSTSTLVRLRFLRK